MGVLIFRSAENGDLQRVEQIYRACAVHMSAGGIEQWNIDYPNAATAMFDLMGDSLYVGELDGKLVAVITLNDEQDDEYESLSWDGDEPFKAIHRLAVDPEHQGKGLAREMMDYAEQEAREQEAKSIRLDTFVKNRRNIKFYENRGYEKRGMVFLASKQKEFICFELKVS